MTASLPDLERWDVALFGERQSRIVVSLGQEHLKEFSLICYQNGVSSVQIGTVNTGSFKIDGLVDLTLKRISDTWGNALEIATV